MTQLDKDLASKPKPTKPKSSSNTLTSTDTNGNKVEVTLVEIFDPASPANSVEGPSPGTRLVGVEFRLTDVSKSSESDDILSDASVIGSNDQTYTPGVNTISECTDFNNGVWSLSPGESSTGCAAIQVPTGVRVARVTFNAAGGFGGTTDQWTVNG